MACPGGCIGGGGQPFHRGRMEVLRRRAAALYREDANKPLRKSHENPYIQQLYSEYLGEPCGPKAHKLLHTHYIDRKEVIGMYIVTEKSNYAMNEIHLPKTKVAELHAICAERNNDPGELINILHAAQGLFGYLPPEVQQVIAAELNIPVSRVYGVVTFYSIFTMTPKGKYTISV